MSNRNTKNCDFNYKKLEHARATRYYSKCGRFQDEAYNYMRVLKQMPGEADFNDNILLLELFEKMHSVWALHEYNGTASDFLHCFIEQKNSLTFICQSGNFSQTTSEDYENDAKSLHSSAARFLREIFSNTRALSSILLDDAMDKLIQRIHAIFDFKEFHTARKSSYVNGISDSAKNTRTSLFSGVASSASSSSLSSSSSSWLPSSSKSSAFTSRDCEVSENESFLNSSHFFYDWEKHDAHSKFVDDMTITNKNVEIQHLRGIGRVPISVHETLAAMLDAVRETSVPCAYVKKHNRYLFFPYLPQ